jgi:hypothetical protein
MEWFPKEQQTVEHVVPLNVGGTHEATNFVPASFAANSSKNDKMELHPVGHEYFAPDAKPILVSDFPVFYPATVEGYRHALLQWGASVPEDLLDHNFRHTSVRLSQTVHASWEAEDMRRKALADEIAEAPRQLRKALWVLQDDLLKRKRGKRVEVGLEEYAKLWLKIQ